MSSWSQQEAIALATLVETVIPNKCGCHVALTGGCLYKEGNRKDCDLLFYRIRQEKPIDKQKLFLALMDIGLHEVKGSGWCHKAVYAGKSVDLFFPEEDGGDYENTKGASSDKNLEDLLKELLK